MNAPVTPGQPVTPRRPVLLLRGATRACAVCGRRGLSTRWVILAERCPRCGFRFERQAGHFVGAVGMNTIVTFALILLTLLVGIAITWPDVRFAPLAAATISVAIVMPPLLHVTAKTLWVAVDLIIHPLQPGELGVIDPQEGPT